MDALSIAYVIGVAVVALITSAAVARKWPVDDHVDYVMAGLLGIMIGVVWPALPFAILAYGVGFLGRWLSDNVEYNPPWRR